MSYRSVKGGAGLVGLDYLVLEAMYQRVEDKILSRVIFHFQIAQHANELGFQCIAWLGIIAALQLSGCNYRVQVLASRTEIDAEDAAASRSAGTAGIFAQVKATEVTEDLFLKVSLRPYSAHQQASYEPRPSLQYIREKSEPSLHQSSDCFIPTCLPDCALNLSHRHRPCHVFLLAQQYRAVPGRPKPIPQGAP